MIQSRWSKVLGVLPLVGALAAFAGCNGQSSTAEDETSVGSAKLEPAAEATERARGHRGMHGKGPEHLLFAALHELDLSDAQRTAIQGEIDALHQAKEAPADFEAHRTALAAAIRSGKVDETALPMPAMKAPKDGTRFAKAMQTLHDTLTPEQRKQLVDAVSAKMDEHEEHFAAKGEKGHMFGPLGHMLRGIEMTDAQREKVRDALAKIGPQEAYREAMKAKHEAFRKVMRERLASFTADRFDASAFTAPPKDAPAFGPEAGHGMMVKALAAVVPILDEAQRAELAKRFEQGPPAGKRGGAHEDCSGK
jgi:Spy/CpxP family protein refolding chaperone